MSNVIINYFNILLLINFIFPVKEENIIENPRIIISDCQNPIIFDGNNDYYNLITKEKIYIIEKITGKTIFINDIFSYDSPYFLFIDESNNYFLYANKEYYNINLNDNFPINNLNKVKTITTDSNIEYTGCITEYKYGSIIDKKEVIL